MNAVAPEPVTVTNSAATEEVGVTRPWEGLATVMRYANRARAAGDLQGAYTLYTRAIDLNPNSAQAWAGRASTTSNLDEAIVAWGYSLALAPDNEARVMLGRCVSEKIGRSGIAQVASLVTLGRRLAEAGQWPWAQRLFARATELDPANEEAWMWRAGIANDASETVACLKRVLELNPQNEQAQAGLQWAASKRTPASAVPNVPEQSAAVLEEGQRALREGDRLSAYGRFKRATELDAQNALAWFWRGSAAPDVDESLECMDQVLSIDPQNEAAKDARWWLRVQKLRERAPALANPHPTPPVVSPYAGRYEPKRNGGVPLIALVAGVLLIVGLLVMLVVLRLAGYL